MSDSDSDSDSSSSSESQKKGPSKCVAPKRSAEGGRASTPAAGCRLPARAPPPGAHAPAARWYLRGSDSDSDSDDGKRVVRSAKARAAVRF